MSGNKGNKPPTTIIQSFDKIRESPRIAAKTDKGPKAMEPEVIKGGAKPTATVSASSHDATALQKQLITMIKEMDHKLSNRLDELDTKFTVGGWVGRWCWVASSAGASYYFGIW